MAGTYVLPTYVTSPPGDASRLFVVEQAGRVRLVKNGVALPTPFLDISDLVLDGGERGLLSVAFPPDYATSGRFYVYFTDTGGDIRIEEYRRSADPDRADRTTRRAVLGIEHSSQSNHNGGQLQFGPDGYLYAGTGDGGGGNDIHDNAQNLEHAAGQAAAHRSRPDGRGRRAPAASGHQAARAAHGDPRPPAGAAAGRRGGLRALRRALHRGRVGEGAWRAAGHMRCQGAPRGPGRTAGCGSG